MGYGKIYQSCPFCELYIFQTDGKCAGCPVRVDAGDIPNRRPGDNTAACEVLTPYGNIRKAGNKGSSCRYEVEKWYEYLADLRKRQSQPDYIPTYLQPKVPAWKRALLWWHDTVHNTIHRGG